MSINNLSLCYVTWVDKRFANLLQSKLTHVSKPVQSGSVVFVTLNLA